VRQLDTRGRAFVQDFLLHIYDGKEAALVRAQAWRDEMARKHPPASRQKLADKVRRNNKSGIPGVVCMFDPQGAPTGWIAQTYLGPGKHLSKYFGVTRYGATEAKLLAIAERQRQLQQMTGLRCVHPGEALVRTAPKRAPDSLPAPKARGTIFLSTNSSGIVGVSSERDKNGRPTRWIATTRLGSKQLSKSFSVLIHGDEQAKALAVAAREEQLQKRAELQRQKSQSEKTN